MEIVWFTLIAIGLYFVSDRILDAVERARGARFEAERQLVFFGIFLALALPTFWLLQSLLGQGAG